MVFSRSYTASYGTCSDAWTLLEIEDENEIEIGIVRNEDDRLSEMDSEDEKKEEEQDKCSGKNDEEERKE